jgi:DNA-directed RNA polymerase specialized sigma24 family protein
MRYYLDLSTAEIAHLMKTSEGTVKSQLSKARAHLAGSLRVTNGNEEPNHADV